MSLTRRGDLSAGRLAVVFDGLGQDIEERERLLACQVEPHARPGHHQRCARQVCSVGMRAGEPSWIASTVEFYPAPSQAAA